MKRILFLADINSAHTRKWAVSLAEKGFEIGIFSFSFPVKDWFTEKRITLLSGKAGPSSVSKSTYLKTLPAIKRAIKQFSPDILHAHYATSYGLLGALSGFHPFIISCWGSDVMEFPNKSIIHKWGIKRILSKADVILATSETIVKHIRKLSKRKVLVTPFGVDVAIFKPYSFPPIFEEGNFVIGTIKSLEKVYCIDVLINAFAEVKKKRSNIKLLLVGEGTQRVILEEQCKKMGITKDVVFAGKIDHTEVPKYHNMIDVFVNISEYESFGVSVLESMACEKPVIVTNTGGLAEIVENDTVGIKVGINDVNDLTKQLIRLLSDAKLRKTLGVNARKLVCKKYDWNVNVEQMISIYNTTGIKK